MARPVRLLLNAVPLTYATTGIGRYARALYAAMTRLHGDELRVGYFDGARVLAAPPRPAEAAGFSRLAKIFWSLPAPAALAVRLARHARQEAAFARAARNFDVYHELAFFPFLAARRLPTLFTLHDLSLDRLPACHPRERVMYHRLLFGRRWPLADGLIAVSEFTKAEAVDLLGSRWRDARVTLEAHDPAVFRPRPDAEVAAVRRRLGLPERYVLTVGSGDPRKNFRLAPPAVRAAAPDAVLAAAGWSGWDRDQADPRVRPLGIVSDEDLAALYSGALALLFLSEYEGFGLPILEAMACGCPVLAARKTSLPEVGGEAAAYVDDPHDAPALAEALRRLVHDRSWREDRRARGLARAAAFSWEKTAAQTMDLIRELAGRGKTRSA